MKEMLATTVVLHVPDSKNAEELIENINSYASFFGKVYIIDNSSFDNSHIALKVPKQCLHSKSEKSGHCRSAESRMRNGSERWF